MTEDLLFKAILALRLRQLAVVCRDHLRAKWGPGFRLIRKDK